MKDYMVTMQNKENEPSEMSEKNLPPTILEKHPLENQWTLWYFDNDKNKNWMDNLHNVYSFHTVEDFWCLYNHIQPASHLNLGNDYALFKLGIEPMWEDKRNKNGGRWVVSIDNKMRLRLDELWLNMVLFMIGESYEEYSDQICGAYINIRNRGNKIILWTADASDIEGIKKIGEKLKFECLQLPQDMHIFYESHIDSQLKGPSKFLAQV